MLLHRSLPALRIAATRPAAAPAWSAVAAHSSLTHTRVIPHAASLWAKTAAAAHVSVCGGAAAPCRTIATTRVLRGETGGTPPPDVRPPAQTPAHTHTHAQTHTPARSSGATAPGSAPAPPAAPGGAPTEPSVSFFTSPLGWWRANNAKLKHMFKTYGYFAVAAYLGVYVATLAGIFALVRMGIIQGPDVNAFLNGLRIKQWITEEPIQLSPALTDFGVAWLLTKTTEPFRLVFTIAMMPVLVRKAPASVLRLFKIDPTKHHQRPLQ